MKKGNELKKVSIIVTVLAVFCFIMSGCGPVTVNPGYTGVKVKFYGDNKGVDPKPYPPGRYWMGFGEDMVTEYPSHMVTKTYTQSTTEDSPTNEEFSMSTSESAAVGLDVSITYRVEPNKAPWLYNVFNVDTDGLNNGFIRQTIRKNLGSVIGTMTIDQVCGAGKTKMIQDTETLVKKDLEKYGIEVVTLSLVNNPRPPVSTQKSINDKINNIQTAISTENQLRTENAKASIKKVQADAEAYYIRTVSSALTPEYVKYVAAQKWKGDQPMSIGGQSIVDLRK